MTASVATPRLVPAAGPPGGPGASRLLVVEVATSSWWFGAVGDLARALAPGDLTVVNDAATLPASLAGTVRGEPVELRLARHLGGARWQVGVLGAGDWRTPTERRDPPPRLTAGDRVVFGATFAARIVGVDNAHVATVVLDAADGRWMDAVYRHGEPVRYSYLGGPVPLAAFQTAIGARPWASESPSAALPLDWRTILGLRAAGVGVAPLTHAAGLSSIDGGDVDASLPWPERADVPAETVAAIRATRARGGRVIAVGTTVARALEGRVDAVGDLLPGVGEVSLVFDGTERPRVVDGLLTKLHAPDESHFRVLTAFAPAELLTDAFDAAAARGLRHHEFGDAVLLLPAVRGV